MKLLKAIVWLWLFADSLAVKFVTWSIFIWIFIFGCFPYLRPFLLHDLFYRIFHGSVYEFLLVFCCLGPALFQSFGFLLYSVEMSAQNTAAGPLDITVSGLLHDRTVVLINHVSYKDHLWPDCSLSHPSSCVMCWCRFGLIATKVQYRVLNLFAKIFFTYLSIPETLPCLCFLTAVCCPMWFFYVQVRQGVLNRQDAGDKQNITVQKPAGATFTLGLLVENQGRINYGADIGDTKVHGCAYNCCP